jgi:hypothetical protein
MRPEYIHVLINPLPVYGMALGLLSLLLALWAKNRPAQGIALLIIFLSAASAWPVLYFGQLAYLHIRGVADTEGQGWLSVHMERAEHSIYVFIALAAVSLFAWFLPRKYPKARRPLLTLTLLLSVVSLGLGAWIASAGGRVRHSEFRTSQPPHLEGEEHHHEH